ncbi:hypothetical protein ODS41_12695 [Pyrobaculum sp. 3827-6]|uniref:hypothetical protein n=1 Tax=Pyrobaculum sp. 3827-6 TaxID=2983604 RepID=UPI0021DB77FC|nr:hypothetical protein [Pyrobaculum sp. 3827-6]MCU7788772.1 hypothetical protein [Pyrobaculum sp. 3827-6]
MAGWLGGTDPLAALEACLGRGDWVCVRSLFTDELHFRVFKSLWEEGLMPPFFSLGILGGLRVLVVSGTGLPGGFRAAPSASAY